MSTRKEELMKELGLIREEEQKKISDETYPTVKHFEGKCFKIEEGGFIKYIKVVNILKEDIFRSFSNEITTPFN